MSGKPTGRLSQVIMLAGSIGLVGAALTDLVAVAGRHGGIPFMGSIEISQAFVIVMAACSIACASLGGSHASVDLVFSRLPDWAQRLATRANAVAAFGFVALLVAASVWISIEHWDTGEQTEFFHIPLRWFRLFWIVMASIAAVAFLRGVLRDREEG